MTKLKYENDVYFSEHAKQRLKKSYMKDDETSPQERFRFVADSFASNQEHADRMYNYASDLWVSFSTPILAYGKNKGSLGISCYLPYIEDTKESLFKKSTESRILSTLGGGVGLGMGIRPRDEKSTGIMPHAKTYDADVNAYKQGSSRRGAVAIYLDVTHPEIMEFITIRDPFGGDANRKSLNIHHGVNITDDFMERVETLSTKELSKAEIEEIDKWVTYHPSGVTRVESVKDIFEKILETRLQTGEPYLHFIDTSNKHLPKPQRDLGMTVKQSNLCLTGDSIIEILYNGEINKIRLDDFVEKYSLGGYHLGVSVKSSDVQTNKITFEEVTFAYKTADVTEIFEISDEKGNTIRCTGDHKIYTENRGYVMAKDLLESDVLKVI